MISNESLGKNASLDLSNDEKKDNEKRSVIVEDNPLSLNDVRERKGDMDFEMAGEPRFHPYKMAKKMPINGMNNL